MGFAEVTEAVMRSAVITNQGLSTIAGMIGAQTDVLTDIARLLRAPLGTQARELYQRGARPLNAGWTEEAVKELTASVEKDPYDPVAQFAHGTAGDNSKAAATMGLVVRYSSDSAAFAPLAAAAAILGSNAYLEVNKPDAAKLLVEQVRARLHDCAELELMAGRLGSDATATARAIQIAPELALDAVSLGLPGAKEAAQRAVDGGAVGAMFRAHAAWTVLGQPSMGLPQRSDLPQAVMAHPGWLRTGAPEMRVVAAQLRRELSDSQAALASARQIVGASPTSDWGPRVVLARGVAWTVTVAMAPWRVRRWHPTGGSVCGPGGRLGHLLRRVTWEPKASESQVVVRAGSGCPGNSLRLDSQSWRPERPDAPGRCSRGGCGGGATGSDQASDNLAPAVVPHCGHPGAGCPTRQQRGVSAERYGRDHGVWQVTCLKDKAGRPRLMTGRKEHHLLNAAEKWQPVWEGRDVRRPPRAHRAWQQRPGVLR